MNQNTLQIMSKSTVVTMLDTSHKHAKYKFYSYTATFREQTIIRGLHLAYVL